jgi:ArsR family transcriptional regulator, arsenate/arsenite/antimonite-responsive transcriptional repressor
MGTTKKLVFDDSIYQTADVFRALGNPARLQILQILLQTKSATCGAIVKQLPLAQSTVSKHLLELKKVHLVAIKVQGKKVIYSLIAENLNFIKDFLTNQINESKKESLELALLLNKTSSKSQIVKRRANPSLKNENYIFSHLILKKEHK